MGTKARRAYIARALRKKIAANVVTVLPESRFIDDVFAYIQYWYSHRRLPRTELTLNDCVFRTRTSDDILSPERVFTTDKEYAKLFIRAVVGEQFNVPTIAILRSASDIDNFSFPSNCVVKPTNGSGRVSFIRGTDTVDRHELKKWLKSSYYQISRERNYKYLKAKLIVEPLIFGNTDIDDVKFFCVDGLVKLIQWDFDRRSNHTRKLLDRTWNDLEISVGYPISAKTPPRPKRLNEMINVAEKIGSHFNFVRIDMYVDHESGTFLVGEITHCPGGAREVFFPKDAEQIIARILFSSRSTNTNFSEGS